MKIAKIEYNEETHLYHIYNAEIANDDQQPAKTIGLESRRDAIIAAKWAGYTHYITPNGGIRKMGT